jgi:hypothetical protein
MRRPLFSSLVLVVLAGGLRVSPALPQAAKEIAFDCKPVRLYRGDTLAVTFDSPHHDEDLAVLNEDNRMVLISFKRQPEDKTDPVIPQGEFGKMKQVRLATADARGSVMEPWVQGKDAAVLKQPQLIFTKTGNYEVIVGHNLKSPNSEIDVCYLYYFDYPRPRNQQKSPVR